MNDNYEKKEYKEGQKRDNMSIILIVILVLLLIAGFLLIYRGNFSDLWSMAENYNQRQEVFDLNINIPDFGTLKHRLN